MDQIDNLLEIEPNSELFAIRRQRMDFVDGTELCRRSVVTPVHGFDLNHALRAALAARIAHFIGRDDLAETYRHMLKQAETTPLLSEIAAGAEQLDAADGFLNAIVHHTDLVTKVPRDATKADIEALETAGLTNPQIIALSELIAFVNFEGRIIAGLDVLGEIA